MPDKEPVSESTRLVDNELRQAGIRWPESVHTLVNALVVRANEAGVKCSRQELVAALLVHGAGLSGEELLALVVAYRQAAVKDILVPATNIRAASITGGDHE